MLSKEQIAERKLGIGGSDIGTILGLNPYKTPVDLWLEKTGQVEPEDLSDNQRVHFGNVLEDVVATEYANRQGVTVRRRNNTIIHPEHDWMRANLDRVVLGQKKILECKTADKWTMNNWGEEGTDQVPESYLAQVAWYQAVTDYNTADLAVLIGGNDFRIYNFLRDLELEGIIIQNADEFWHYNVIDGIQPEPTCERDLQTLWAIDNGKAIVATPHIEETARQLAAVKARIKKDETMKKDMEFEIKKFIGPNMEVVLDGEGSKLATWKTSKDSSYFDRKAFESDSPLLAKRYVKTEPGKRPFLLRIKD